MKKYNNDNDEYHKHSTFVAITMMNLAPHNYNDIE